MRVPKLKSSIATALVGGALLASTGACDGQKPHLTVAVAASLSDVITQLEADFEASHPGFDFRFTTASSGTLATQLAAGLPADLFISASPDWVERLDAKGQLVTDSLIPIAENELVLVTAAASKLTLDDFQRDKDLKLAVGEPDSVPAGHYARLALGERGIWGPLQARGQLVYAGDVRQATVYAQRNQVDGAVVYASDLLNRPELRVIARLPLPQSQRIRYWAALLHDAKYPAEAKWVLNYLSTEPGAALLRAAGFKDVDGAPREKG